MARSKVQPKGPDWPPEQTLRLLRQQLEKLREFKGRNYQEVENEEEVWTQTTQGALIRGFGEGSHNVNNYYGARSAGIHNMMGISHHQRH